MDQMKDERAGWFMIRAGRAGKGAQDRGAAGILRRMSCLQDGALRARGSRMLSQCIPRSRTPSGAAVVKAPLLFWAYLT